MPTLSLGITLPTKLRPPSSDWRDLIFRRTVAGRKFARRMSYLICGRSARHGLGLAGDGGMEFPRNNSVAIRIDSEDMWPDVRREVGGAVGSAGDFSGELLGNDKKEIKKKKRSVAGVDQDDLLDPSLLADPDSCFHEFRGLQIHHKICDSEEYEEEELIGVSGQEGTSHSQARDGRLRMPMILLHGFGASVFSWHKVMKPLSNLVGSKVLAFDRPAFGLTSRMECPPNPSSSMAASSHLNPYSMAFSVLATLSFIDLLTGEKSIIVGHSAGCLVAVDTYFEAPERIAALILVAPAIVAPLISSNTNQKNLTEREDGMESEESGSSDRENLFYRIWRLLCALFFQVQSTIIRMFTWIMNLISYFYKKLVAAALRSYIGIMLIRIAMDRFGIPAVRNSWHDATQLTEHDINGYTKPLRAKGWDIALLEFIIAMLIHRETEKKPSCKNILSEIACPVLIITGDDDRIVPAWNAKRLSLAIPGSHLEVIKNCGHLPHEERAEEFLSAVRTFLLKVFSNHSNHMHPDTACYSWSEGSLP